MSFIKRIFGHVDETPARQGAADLELCAPVAGTIVPLEDVPDPVICERIAGDGIAFIPEGNTICAPCYGEICRLLASNTAFAVRAQNGIEVYVRFGIGTDDLGVEGFTALKKVGERVLKGEPVISIDLAAASKNLRSTVTSMIVMNSSADIEKVTSAGGQAKGPETPCTWVYLKKDKD